MGRMNDRAEAEQKLTQPFIQEQDEDVRINIIVRRSLLEWLDKAVQTYNATHPRTTNRSEVIRLLLAQLRESGLDELV